MTTVHTSRTLVFWLERDGYSAGAREGWGSEFSNEGPTLAKCGGRPRERRECFGIFVTSQHVGPIKRHISTGITMITITTVNINLVLVLVLLLLLLLLFGRSGLWRKQQNPRPWAIGFVATAPRPLPSTGETRKFRHAMISRCELG